MDAVKKLSAADWKEHSFETPAGPVTVNRLPDVEELIEIHSSRAAGD
jgi:hypothetical protein